MTAHLSREFPQRGSSRARDGSSVEVTSDASSRACDNSCRNRLPASRVSVRRGEICEREAPPLKIISKSAESRAGDPSEDRDNTLAGGSVQTWLPKAWLGQAPRPWQPASAGAVGPGSPEAGGGGPSGTRDPDHM